MRIAIVAALSLSIAGSLAAQSASVFIETGRRANKLAPVRDALIAQNERVVFVVMGDSTGHRASSNVTTSYQNGWPTSFEKTLRRWGIPQVATGFVGANADSGGSTGTRYGYNHNQITADAGAATEAIGGGPAAWANLLPTATAANGLGTTRGWFRISAIAAFSGGFTGVVLNGSDTCNASSVVGDPSCLSLTGGLTARYLHGVDATGGSTPVEFAVAGGSAAGRGSGTIDCAVPTVTYTGGKSGRTSIAIASGAANVRDFYVGWKRRSSAAFTPSTGGVLLLGGVVEDASRTWGYSMHTLVQGSGFSLFDMATAVNVPADDWYTAYFSFLRELASGTPKKVVFLICSGFNDRNEASASYKSALSPGDSTAAYKDNLDAIRDKMLAVWSTNGWGANELFFVSIPSWQISSPDDSELISYRTASAEWAALYPQCVSADPMRHVAFQQLLNMGDNDASSFDPIHLCRQGYEIIGESVAIDMLGVAPGPDSPFRGRP